MASNGDVVFVECSSVPSVLLSVSVVVIDSRTLSSTTLDTDCFAE